MASMSCDRLLMQQSCFECGFHSLPCHGPACIHQPSLCAAHQDFILMQDCWTSAMNDDVEPNADELAFLDTMSKEEVRAGMGGPLLAELVHVTLCLPALLEGTYVDLASGSSTLRSTALSHNHPEVRSAGVSYDDWLLCASKEGPDCLKLLS